MQELNPNFAAFPTYPIILPFKHTDSEVIDFYARSDSTPIKGVPKFDTKHVLDGERKLEFLKPIPVTSEGRKFEVRSKVLGVYDKGKPGTVVETEKLLVDAQTGEVYTREVGSGFYVGQGGWGGPKGKLSLLHAASERVLKPQDEKANANAPAQGPKLSTSPRPLTRRRPHPASRRPLSRPRCCTVSTAITTRFTRRLSRASRWASAGPSSTACSAGIQRRTPSYSSLASRSPRT